MKKTKKYLALLSAVMMTASCAALSVYADETTNNSTNETVLGDANEDGVLNVRDAAHIARFLAENRADELPECADYNGDGAINVRDAAAIARTFAGYYDEFDRTINMLSDFIDNNNIYAQVMENQNNERRIIINYYYTHTDVEPTIKAFIEENGLDESCVVFQSVGSESSGADEKITDICEIIALIDDFRKENDYKFYIYLPSDVSTAEVLQITYYWLNWGEGEFEELISNFLTEKNIDETKVEIIVMETGDGSEAGQ